MTEEKFFVFNEYNGTIDGISWCKTKKEAKIEAESRKKDLREDEFVYIGEVLCEIEREGEEQKQ